MTEQKSDDALLTECQQLLKTIDNLESVYASTNAESDAARLVRLLLELVQPVECPSCAELRARITQLEQEKAAIYQGFVRESLNGVVCSIPDTGLDTPPHRTWCARCQKRYRRLAGLADRAPRVSSPEPQEGSRE
jgi:hypothetical protein